MLTVHNEVVQPLREIPAQPLATELLERRRASVSLFSSTGMRDNSSNVVHGQTLMPIPLFASFTRQIAGMVAVN